MSRDFAARRAGLPPRGEPPQVRSERDGTPIGGMGAAPFVRLPDPAALFRRRADRLAALADEHPLGPFLWFLAGLVHAQDRVCAELPPPPSDAARLNQRLAATMPPLSKDDLSDASGFPACLDRIATAAATDTAPLEAEAARARVLAASPPERLALADAVFDGAYPAENLGESLYVAAALQVHLARLAAQLDPKAIRPVADGVCPVCGSTPVASTVVGWSGAGHARYCCCGLCGTRWNYVRVKCTACASTAKLEYLAIEDGSDDVAAETCGECRSYIKHYQQHRAPDLDPVADDIASFALDLLVREKGFARTTPNPFMITP